jgi:hypothetical protein
MADKRRTKQSNSGCLWILMVLSAILLSVALAFLASAPVLVIGIVLAVVIVTNPGHAGDRVRRWGVWRRLPLLRTRTGAVGFTAVLLLYAVPVPGVLTYALVASTQSNGAGQPSSASGQAAAPTPNQQFASATATPEATPTATAVPTPVPTATPVATATPRLPAPPVHTAAPPPPPASTCSASVKFPAPGTGGEQTVYVSSNVPNASVAIAVHYKTTTHPFTGSTNAAGTAAITFSIGRPTAGYRVNVGVTVGAASCSTSFTPQ